MSFLLDICVLSEFTRRLPNTGVLHWLNKTDEETLFLSAITVGEIQRGIERLDVSTRKTDLFDWLENGLVKRFIGRILPVDTQIILLWGSLTANSEKAGRPLSIMDSLIASTALYHNLIIVTRNESDFTPCGVKVLNPWDEEPFSHFTPVR